MEVSCRADIRFPHSHLILFLISPTYLHFNHPRPIWRSARQPPHLPHSLRTIEMERIMIPQRNRDMAVGRCNRAAAVSRSSPLIVLLFAVIDRNEDANNAGDGADDRADEPTD